MRVFLLLAMMVLAGCGQENDIASETSTGDRPVSDDYMSADLRDRVEALKVEVREKPLVESAPELQRRALTLFAWANAMALRGDDLPWSLPQAVAQVARSNDLPRGEEPTEDQLRALNTSMSDYIEQLRLRDENPAALGKVTVPDPGPYTVTSWQTIEVQYEVGSGGLKEGAMIMLGAHGVSGLLLQAEDGSAEDYVTSTISRSGVSLVAEGVEGSFRRRTLVFSVTGGDLQPGDVVTFLYGDTGEGGPGARLQTFSNDFIPMEVHVAFEPDGTRYALPRFGFKTQGGPTHGVRGFAPSVLDVGETFSLSVRSEDIYTNRATSNLPGYRLLLDGEPIRDIPAGSAITLLDNFSFDTPGVYRLSLESLDGSIQGKVNPILVEKNPEQRIYWGETHGHSGMAEGQGTSDAYFEFGRDDARLDFLVHSEHDIWMDDAEWEELRANTQEFFETGKFITFLGYEWTVEHSYGGHHNIVFRTPEHRRRVPQQTHASLSKLYQGLRENHDTEDVLIIPHAHQAGDWRRSDPAMQTLVEIQSNHGVFEWFGHMYLRHGQHVGFVSGSDDHTSHPGYGASRGRGSGLAGVLAREKTADAIFDAMKSLSTYAVTGDRPIVRFEVNGTGMGQRAEFSEQRSVRGRIVGTSPIDQLVVLKNSEEIWRKDLRTVSAGNSSTQTIEVNFESSSQPLMEQRDNPRGSRTWQGTINVKNATLVRVDAPSFNDVVTQSFEIDEDNSNLIRFRTWTRGNHSSLILELEGVSAATEIQVNLEPDRETQNGFTRYRGTVQIPQWNRTFRLAEMKDGFLERTQEAEGYYDSVELRRVVRQAPMDYEFEFADEAGRQGDYYTLRVVQENDQMAWSSPVWVGGYTAR
ncbi:MAG: DUF3604 domain-containing protein [Pseudomonadales bacterium]